MDVTLLGMMTEFRLLQRENALDPMDVTPWGMVTEVMLQPAKALDPMDVTLLGMTVFLHPIINLLFDVFIIALQLLRESYFSLPLSTFMEIRPMQPLKAS